MMPLLMKTALTFFKISWVESGAEYPFTISTISLYKYIISFDQPSYGKNPTWSLFLDGKNTEEYGATRKAVKQFALQPFPSFQNVFSVPIYCKNAIFWTSSWLPDIVVSDEWIWKELGRGKRTLLCPPSKNQKKSIDQINAWRLKSW